MPPNRRASTRSNTDSGQPYPNMLKILSRHKNNEEALGNKKPTSPQDIEVHAADRIQRHDTPMLPDATDATPQSAPAVPGHKGVIVARDNDSCLVYYGNRFEHMANATAKNLQFSEKIETGRTKLNSSTDFNDLQKIRKKDPSKFRTEIEHVYSTQPYGNNVRSTVVKLNGDDRLYIMSKSNAAQAMTKALYEERNENFDDSATSQGTSVLPVKPSKLSTDKVKAVVQENKDVTMLSPVSDAPSQSAPAVPGHKGVIVARDNDSCLVYYGNRFEHMANATAKNLQFSEKIETGRTKLNSSTDFNDLQKIRKKDPSKFRTEIEHVYSTQPYGNNVRSTVVKLNGDDRLYIMSKSNAAQAMTKALYEERNENFDDSATSQGTSVLPVKPSKLSTDKVKAVVQENKDVTMLSPVSDAPSQSAPAVPGHKGVIVARDNDSCLVYYGNRFEHMANATAKNLQFSEKIETGRTKLNSSTDFNDLQKIRKKDPSKFRTEIEHVYSTQPYGNNVRSTVVKLNGDDRLYIMSKSNAAQAMTKALYEERNENFDGSPKSRNEATDASQLIIPSVETPCPSPRPRRAAKMGNPQECSGKYVIVGKDLKNGKQQVESGTPCLVRDDHGVHKVMLWSEIREAELKGNAVFDDPKYNSEGMHPTSDREYLEKMEKHKKINDISIKEISIKDAILWKYVSKSDKIVWYKTVFSDCDESGKLTDLYKARKAAGDDSKGPIRSSRSAFVKAGGSQAALDNFLKEKDPELWEEYVNCLKRRSGRDRSETPPLPDSITYSEWTKMRNDVEWLKRRDNITCSIIEDLEKTIKLLKQDVRINNNGSPK